MIDIVGKRGWYFLISALIILPGLISLIVPPGWASWESGLNPGIDFTSGSVLQVSFAADVTEQHVHERMVQLGHSEALIQKTGSNTFFIRTKLLKEPVGDLPSEREVVERDLEEFLALERDKVKFDSVSPIIAGETVINAFYAILAASVFILLYIWYAFRRVPKSYRYGVAAILALVHDVVIVIGIFSILGKVLDIEVNSMFIVGVLIVAGYSVNDTIVVFDRIRENFRSTRRGLAEGIVNISINQMLGRTIITSLTTLFVVLSLLLLGGEAVRGFSIALIVGVFIGTYSSIYTASSTALALDVSPEDLLPPQKGELVDDLP